jgi:hypothetical protein
MQIVEIYRKTKKSRDQIWNTYVCRPIAAVFVYLFAPTPITPNQVTFLSFFVCLGAVAVLLTVPGYVGLVTAIALYELSYVLDFLMDELKAFIVLAAVSVRWFWETLEPERLIIGLFGLTCLASGIALTTFLRRPEISGKQADFKPNPDQGPSLVGRLIQLIETLAKFLIHYPSYIWIAALLGHLEYYVYPYVVVNAVYVARAGTIVLWRFGRG